MARRRMIDPSIWDDEDVGSLSNGAFRLFIACISNADDEGKLEASPKRLRATAFKYVDGVTLEQTEQWLVEIEHTLRSFLRYTVNGRQYVKLTNWRRYQTIQKPQPSTLPDPPNDSSTTITVPVSYSSSNDTILVNDHYSLREVNRSEEKRSEGHTPAIAIAYHDLFYPLAQLDERWAQLAKRWEINSDWDWDDNIAICAVKTWKRDKYDTYRKQHGDKPPALAYFEGLIRDWLAAGGPPIPTARDKSNGDYVIKKAGGISYKFPREKLSELENMSQNLKADYIREYGTEVA